MSHLTLALMLTFTGGVVGQLYSQFVFQLMSIFLNFLNMFDYVILH